MRFGVLIVLVGLAGCVTTGGQASLQKADGTVYSVQQRNMAVAGGRAKAAEEQFVATYKMPDGTEVEVKMGNNVEQPESPNSIQNMTELIQTVGALATPIPGP